MLRAALLPVLLASATEPGVFTREPAPWWRKQGAPVLVPLGHTSFQLEGVPHFVDQAYFLDAGSLRAKLGPHPAPGAVYRAIQEGQVWVGCRLRMVVGVGAAKRRFLLGRALAAAWQSPGFDVNRPDIQAFLDFNGRLLNPEETYEYLFSPTNVLHVRYQGGDFKTFRSPELVKAFRRIEFSDDPENPDVVLGMARDFAARMD